ncbi:MAG: hypothetical protein K0S58_1050 [Nitrospira sp.]|nr:hypothetical protein [Nitrospira sp.]
MPKHFKLRSYQRILLCGTCYYLSDDFLGRGTVWDFSSGGWRIQGDHQVQVGMPLILRMDLSDEKSPLEIEQAVVQWVSGRDFGVQIRKMRRTSAKKLERLLGRHCILPQG